MSSLPPLHLLWRDGAPLTAPHTMDRDTAGARLLAELYAPPADRVWVRAMMNTTIDGAIAGADGISASLRNEDDAFVFGVLRALCDVVLVGASTVRAEDYRRPLGRRDLLEPSRRPGGGERPALAIWTRSGDLPSSVEPDWPTHLLVPSDQVEAVRRRTGFPAENVHAAETAAEGIAVLGSLGFRAIQAEGGPQALAHLAAADLLDELCFSVTHRTVGGASPRVLDGAGHRTDWALASLLVGPDASLTRYVRESGR